MYITHNTPCSTSTQHHSDTVSCQNPGQSRKVRVAVRTLLKNTLIQLSLQVKHKGVLNRTGRDSFRLLWARAESLRRHYQFRLTPLGKHSAGARQVMVSGDPAPHVQPLGRPSGRRAVLSVQQHQLLLSPNCTALQHLLQLQRKRSMWEPPGSFPYWERKTGQMAEGFVIGLSVAHMHLNQYTQQCTWI